MSEGIIDGHTGSAHITSDDIAAMNAALYGTNQGVFNGLKVSVSGSSARTVAVAAGAGLVCARRFRFAEAQEITIPGSGSGTYYISVEYAVNESGIENVAISALTKSEITQNSLELAKIDVSSSGGITITDWRDILPSLSATDGKGACCYQGSNTEISLSADTMTKIPLYTSIYNTSDKYFTLSSGGIKCVKAGYVKVSASAYIVPDSSGGEAVGTFVYKNKTSATGGIEVNSANISLGGLFVSGGVSTGTSIVKVAAGDVLSLWARCSSVSAKVAPANNATYLTLEYV